MPRTRHPHPPDATTALSQLQTALEVLVRLLARQAAREVVQGPSELETRYGQDTEDSHNPGQD